MDYISTHISTFRTLSMILCGLTLTIAFPEPVDQNTVIYIDVINSSFLVTLTCNNHPHFLFYNNISHTKYNSFSEELLSCITGTECCVKDKNGTQFQMCCCQVHFCLSSAV